MTKSQLIIVGVVILVTAAAVTLVVTHQPQKTPASPERVGESSGTNGKPPEPAKDGQDFQPQTVPKATWRLAGYATPEAALQSFVWGMSRGDKQTILGSFTVEIAGKLSQTFGNKSDTEFAAETAAQFNGVQAYQILGRETVADDEVNLLVSFQAGSDHPKKIKLKKIDGQWKLANADLIR